MTDSNGYYPKKKKWKREKNCEWKRKKVEKEIERKVTGCTWETVNAAVIKEFFLPYFLRLLIYILYLFLSLSWRYFHFILIFRVYSVSCCKNSQVPHEMPLQEYKKKFKWK